MRKDSMKVFFQPSDLGENSFITFQISFISKVTTFSQVLQIMLFFYGIFFHLPYWGIGWQYGQYELSTARSIQKWQILIFSQYSPFQAWSINELLLSWKYQEKPHSHIDICFSHVCPVIDHEFIITLSK